MAGNQCVWGWVLGVLAVAWRAAAADVVLVENGQARAQVVVTDTALPVVRDVAADFVRVVKRMSGVELALVAESKSDAAQPRVLIGACKAPQGLDADPATITGDEAYAGYVIACGQNCLVLAGNSPAGTANAVYGFLQDQLGVRWFLPTELFEIAPPLKSITIPELRRVVTPSFVCRLGSASWDKESLPWARHNRWDAGANEFTIPYASGFRHWMYAVFPPSKYGKTNPDIYPLLNGKRAVPENDGEQLAQPCTGNPETVRIAIEVVNTYLTEHPDTHTYPFSINDNNTWCECDLCRAQDVERPEYRGRRIYSDRWFTFVNAVAKGVSAKHPGKFIGCFAYWGVELPPLKIERLEPNVFVNLTQDTAQYFDSDYKTVDYDLIRAWQQKCQHVGKYDYYGLGALAPRYFPHLLAADLKAIHGMGARAFHSELYPYWANMGPMLYVASRLLWDVTLDPDALLEEFYTATFGAVAPDMRAFYQTHEAAWMSQKKGLWFGGIGSAAQQMDFYTSEEVAEAASHLQKAEALAADDTVRARVRYIAQCYAYPDLLLRAWTAARDVTQVKAQSTAAAKSLAPRIESLLVPLGTEDAGWQKSIVEDPIVDAWYKNGARPNIRGLWRARVQGGLIDGVQALGAWAKTPEGTAASAEERQVLDRIAAHPQVGLLWQALQGTLRRGPNLLPNPGFEESKTDKAGPAGPEWQTASVAAGWSTWQQFQDKGKFFLDGSVKHAGNSAGAFEGGECLCYITTVPVEAGKTYLAEVWAMAPAVRENTKVTLEVRWHDVQGHWYNGAANHRVETKSSGAWERLLIPFVAPKDVPRAVFLLVGEGIAVEDVVRYDDAFLGEAATGPAAGDAKPGAER
ncbi:MAG: hypothetical protein A3K19_04990 [Lentisphaerae bacterium RIFOXYB12_FULL_65_16]|nr:MAG: hypothetical protein A3K18_35360 [Lentisphaerae bacterium RIFOXYA12_64_32]OGV89747.1 MAG: hypothetical protein A3K19_04990 [Lentisphaerae bacterium RIFOXYB12_FULL_65_16]